MATLYIIGNGFDLYHGFKTGYINFKEWLKNNHYEKYSIIEKYSQQGIFSEPLYGNWSNIEKALVLSYEKFSVAEPIDDKLRISQKGLKDMIITSNIIEVFQGLFNSWIFDINRFDISQYSGRIIKSLSNDDYYLTFNYTRTLEKVYKIAYNKDGKLKIYYLHNCVIGETEKDKLDLSDSHDVNKLVFGSYKNSNFASDVSTIKGYKTRFYKDPNLRIRNMEYSFLSHIHCIDKVIVLGHSINSENGDMEYFKYLLDKYNDVPWTVSWYNKEDLEAKQNALIEYNNIKFVEFK